MSNKAIVSTKAIEITNSGFGLAISEEAGLRAADPIGKKMLNISVPQFSIKVSGIATSFFFFFFFNLN